MPFNATLSVTQQRDGWRNSIEGEFVGAKRNVSEVRNEMQTAGYGLLHLRSRYEHDAWSVEIGVENLLDRFYDDPLGGAYVGQGTTMTIPPAPNEPRWGTPVPGAGRGIEWVLCMGNYGGTLILSLRTVRPSGGAGQLIQRLLRGLGQARGHGQMAGGKVTNLPSDRTARSNLVHSIRDRFLNELGLQDQAGRGIFDD